MILIPHHIPGQQAGCSPLWQGEEVRLSEEKEVMCLWQGKEMRLSEEKDAGTLRDGNQRSLHRSWKQSDGAHRLS